MRIEYSPGYQDDAGVVAGTAVAWLTLTEEEVEGPVSGLPIGPSLGGPVNLIFDGPGRLVELEFMDPHSVFRTSVAAGDPDLPEVLIHVEHEELFDNLIIWFTPGPPDPDEVPALTIRRLFHNGAIEFSFAESGHLERLDVFEATTCLPPEVIAGAAPPDWLDRGFAANDVERREETEGSEKQAQSEAVTKAILTNLTHLEGDEGLDRSVRRAAKEGRQRLESASNVVGTARALHRWFWENDAAYVELSFDDQSRNR